MMTIQGDHTCYTIKLCFDYGYDNGEITREFVVNVPSSISREELNKTLKEEHKALLSNTGEHSYENVSIGKIGSHVTAEPDHLMDFVCQKYGWLYTPLQYDSVITVDA